jgi:hypothetical protein
MKLKPSFVAAVIMVLALVKPPHGFAQQTQVLVRDITDDLKEFSYDMAGAAPFMASMGLDWADTYIGPLIDITPHWGIGITMGAATLKLDKLNALLKHFGYQADDGFQDKQLLPAYTINARLGGFSTMPFDIGIKWGWLPYAPIFKNDISYEAVIYGMDFRWELTRDWGLTPSMSVGFEVNRTTGGLRARTPLALYIYGIGNPTKIDIVGDATVGPVWEAWVFDLKLQVAKKFWEPRFTAFGGVRAGAALTRTGYQIAGSGGDVSIPGGYTLEGMSDAMRDSIAKILETESGSNDMKFEVNTKSITGWIDSIGINLNLHGGLVLDFNNGIRLDLSLMVDILHIELGANIAFRYQNGSLSY